MIHSILHVQFMCSTVILHNLSPIPLWSISWSWTLHFILHTFLHPIIVFFSQHMRIVMFCCSTEIMSSNLSLSLNSLSGTPTYFLNATHPSDHSRLCPLKCHLIFLYYSQVSLPCNILLRTQLLYSLPLIINDISILVSNGINCLNLFHQIRILASTAASASPSRLNMSSCQLITKVTH